MTNRSEDSSTQSLGDRILQEQVDYYKARANEYDDWYLRKGRYNYGKSWNNKWFSEVRELKNVLKKFNPKEKVLELAPGTGWWTEELIKYADSITYSDHGGPEITKDRSNHKR